MGRLKVPDMNIQHGQKRRVGKGATEICGTRNVGVEYARKLVSIDERSGE